MMSVFLRPPGVHLLYFLHFLFFQEGLSVRFHQLDIDDEESITTFKTHLEETYGGLDVLVNNAAIAYKVRLIYLFYCSIRSQVSTIDVTYIFFFITTIFCLLLMHTYPFNTRFIARDPRRSRSESKPRTPSASTSSARSPSVAASSLCCDPTPG